MSHVREREVLRGDLQVLSLPGVLQMVGDERLTGRLLLGEQSEIGLFQGRPVGARHAALEGVPAVLELLIEPPQDFTLHAGEPAASQPIGEMITLVMEGCRLADEWARISTLSLRLDQEPGAEVGEHARKLLSALRPGHAIGVVARALALPRVHLVDPILGLVESGAGDLVELPSGAPTSSAELDFDTALDEGRRLLKADQLEEARAAFELALLLRPDDRIARQNLRRLQQLLRDRAPQATAASSPATPTLEAL